jgi:single-strand DNA-binding protein
MSDLNVIAFSGRLTRDPDLKYSKDGKPIVKYGVAINEKWGQTEKVHFIDCTTFGKFAETVAQYLKKGSRIAGRGKLDYQSWDGKEGRRTKLAVIVQDITFLDSRETKVTDKTGEMEGILT